MFKNRNKIYCGNCSYLAEKDDKFCRKCGTEIGKGKYRPENDLMECIYRQLFLLRF